MSNTAVPTDLRNVTYALPEGSIYRVPGDFNTYYSYQPAFLKLLDNTSTGYFIDPINAVGYGHNNFSFAAIQTQSTRVDQIRGGSNGGLDDRFDMILASPFIMNGGRIIYIGSTLITYVNEGQHFNKNINDPP